MLSDISSIVNTIEVKDDFSFVDVLASFIGNRELYHTYEQFRDGHSDDPTAYIWYALSAIGNEVGKKIHTNIRDYIDLVSNVDRCKAKNLQSMFNIYGQRYNLIDNIERYPIEVQQLIDIFSLNKRYILKNDFLNEDFTKDLYEEGVLTDLDCGGNYKYVNTTIDQGQYEKYVKGIFYTLLSDFLDLEYNDYNRTKIRDSLTVDDLRGYSLSTYSESTEIEQFKNDNNIPFSFDEKAIVDSIEDGTDTLENYSGVFLELLQKELSRRASTLVYSKLPSNKTTVNTDSESTERKTRYSYYRKAKVIEYFNFIKNFFSDVNELSNTVKYDYDGSYFMMIENESKDVLVYNPTTQGYDINDSIVDIAAEQLKNISMYIATLRERLKLQTRKNYMKGTANLLIYLVNQYIVDYAKFQTTLFNQLSNTSLSTLRERLQTHNPLQVKVIEYFDETEYFNIKAATDKNALNGGSTNLRYWQGQESQETGEFLTDDINKFYMRDLRLSSDSQVSNLIEFLDVIYNLGANTSYIDKASGLFSAKIKSNPDVYSVTMYHALTSLQEHWNKFNQYIISDFPYSYPTDYISNQISNVVDDYISGYLSVQHLSAISSIYDKYIDEVNQISTDIFKLNTKYNNFLSNDYAFYYEKSNRPACYNGDQYKHNYYINNQQYDATDLLGKLTDLKQYSIDNVDTNIVFWGLYDTSKELSTNLKTLSSVYKGGTPADKTIFGMISAYGYVDLSSSTLHESLDDCESFVEQQINARLEYLKNLVSELLQTARDLKTEHNTVDTTFTNAVASYDDDNATDSLMDNVLYTIALNTLASGKQSSCSYDDGIFCKRTKNPTEAKSKASTPPVVCVKQESVVYYYYEMSATGEKTGYPYGTTVVGTYSPSDSLENRCDNIMGRLEVPTSFTVDSEGGIDAVYYNRMKEGIYAVCTNTKASLASLNSSFNQLTSTLNDVGITVEITGNSIIKKLDSLISKLTTTDASKEFADDPILSSLNNIKRKIINLRAEYNPKYDEYSNMVSDKDFSFYLANFNFKSTEYSFKELEKIFDYITETDTTNRDKIRELINEMFDDYTKIKTDYNNLELSVSKDVMSYEADGIVVEDQLENLRNELRQDIVDRTDYGIAVILSVMDDVNYHIGFVANEISSDMDSMEPLSDVVDSRIRVLDYRDTDEYLSSEMHFKMYNGLCSDSDIYYNYKNITHPSKQYHPYLWNFINSDEYSSLFQNIFSLNTIENLNEDKIQRYISGYIGTFGQSINFWKNDGIDYTGYSSRYETSNHLTGQRRSVFQKVVDYDGAFFPDAVEYLRQTDKNGRNIGVQNCISSIQYGIDLAEGRSSRYSSLSSFFVEYYQPLELSKYELAKEQDRIRKFGSVISVITNPVPENQIFDIYKYGLDEFDNSFTLFKRYVDENGDFYDIDDISYSIKKNTPGRLWVRKAAYPFAFPAFSTRDGKLSSSDGSLSVNFSYLYSLLGKEMLSTSNYLSGQMYDFEFSKDRNSLALIMENNTLSGLKKYDTAEVLVSQIFKDMGYEQDYDLVIEDKDVFKKERVGTLMGDKDHAAAFQTLSAKYISDVYTRTLLEAANSDMSVIFSSKPLSTLVPSIKNNKSPIENIIQENGALSSIREQTVQNISKSLEFRNILSAETSSMYYIGPADGYWYALVDCVPNGNNNFYTVYAKKHIKSERVGGKLSATILLDQGSNFRLINYNSQSVADAGGIQFPRKPTNDSVAFSICDTTTVAFGVVLDSILSIDNSMINSYTLSGHILSSDNANGYIKDDPFHTEMNSHDVFDSDIYVTKYSVRYQTLYPMSDKIFNINADMSYLPSYPGKDKRINVMSLPDISANQYHPVELLGQSRNIDELIDMINPTPNPYFSFDDISANHVFGRVYEDYVKNCDKTLKILGNPDIHNNRTNTDEVSCNGGNFYWRIDLLPLFEGANYKDADLLTLRLLMFNRNNFGKNPYVVCDISSIQNKEMLVSYNQKNTSGFEVEIIGGQVDATGTYDNEHVNSIENNRFFNINQIGIKYITKGNLESGNETRKLEVRFKIEDMGLIDHTFINKDVICLCLMNDRDLSMFKYYHYLDAYGLYISAETFDYSMYQDKIGDGYSVTYDKDFLSAKLSAGYWNYYYDKYGKKQYLRDVNFEKYNYLSDIEVLQGYKKAIFKYDEELHFDLSDENFYYPTINLKYPKTLGSYMSDRAIDMNFTEGVNLTTIFDNRELFVIDPVDSQSIFKNIGKIRIDISSDNTGFFMADEDFFDSRENQYSNNDARIFEYLMLTETPSTPLTVNVNKKTVDDVVSTISSTGTFPMGVEEGSIVETKIIDVSTSSSDVNKLLRMYVNYKKDPDNGNGLVLYFNYFNYLNTPFIRIEDFKVYSEIIEGTYLKLAPGESGKLDIIVQFKYYDDGIIRGVKNVKMLTYQIFNISDDKPKFIMREIYRIDKDSDVNNQTYDFSLYGHSIKLSLTESMLKHTEFMYTISWSSTTKLKEIQFDALYDGEAFIVQNPIQDNIQIDSIGPSSIHVKITNPSANYVELKFLCRESDSKMKQILENPSLIQVDELKVTPQDSKNVIIVNNIIDGSVEAE